MRLVLPVMAACLLMAAPACAHAGDPSGDALTAQGCKPDVDPAPDPHYPARMEAFSLSSHGADMNAVMYVASGAGPHPVLLLLHGFPGNEKNLDLAQAARRAGWHVLTFSYRGAWGSGGSFSFGNAVEDVGSALQFLRSDGAKERFGMDSGRIIVAGHSMGAFAAVRAAATDGRVAGLVLLDGWDPGKTGLEIEQAEALSAWQRAASKNIVPLDGTSVAALTDELRSNRQAFLLETAAEQLAQVPLLNIVATRGIPDDTAPLVAAITAKGGNVVHSLMESDHVFSDKRLALTCSVLDWLSKRR